MATKKKSEVAAEAVAENNVTVAVSDETEKTVEKTAVDVESEKITEETAVSVEAGAEAETSTPAKARMYVGASLPGIEKNTVFEGTTPPKLNVPFVCELVIPVENYPSFIQKKGVTSSREAFCYRESAKYAKKLWEEAKNGEVNKNV